MELIYLLRADADSPDADSPIYTPAIAAVYRNVENHSMTPLALPLRLLRQRKILRKPAAEDFLILAGARYELRMHCGNVLTGLA